MSSERWRDQKILDHGYLRFVEKWGSDESVIEAARMSTGKGFMGWGPVCSKCGSTQDAKEQAFLRRGHVYCPDDGTVDPPTFEQRDEHAWSSPGDEKLLAYLYKNKHMTPFEMCGVTIEVCAPIFVFREWMRHRVPFSYNEMSARYTPLPDVNYVPTVERLMLNSKTNKQAGTIKGAEDLTENLAAQFRSELQVKYREAEELYQWALQAGVPKELARVHLPVGRYSRMRASANLRGWMNFLELRDAPHAQFEIREYARALRSMLREFFPRTMTLYDGVHS